MMRTAIRFYLFLAFLLLTGCATAPQPSPSKSAYLIHPDRTTAMNIRLRILGAAESLLGARYKLGGNSADGVDCSGLVHYAYQQAGVDVPRTADQLYHGGLLRERVEPGDLLFFTTSPTRVSHVGIYAGHGQMIHASSRTGRVQKVSLDHPYWRKHLVGGATFLACTGC